MNTQAAEEAIAQALIESVMDNQTISWASDLPEWSEVDRLAYVVEFAGMDGSIDIGHIAQVAFEAARLHLEAGIREDIAADIRARNADLLSKELAARIAEGKQ